MYKATRFGDVHLDQSSYRICQICPTSTSPPRESSLPFPNMCFLVCLSTRTYYVGMYYERRSLRMTGEMQCYQVPLRGIR